MKISRIFFTILLVIVCMLALTVFVRWAANRDSTELIPQPSNVEYIRWELPKGAKARLGKGSINAIKFSPDGKRFAVATTIGVWMYDAQTGTEISIFKGDRQNIKAVTFSPDGSLLIGVNSAGGILQWNEDTGELRAAFVNEKSRHLTSAVFSVDGTKLYSVGGVNDKKIHVRDIGDHTTSPIFSEIELGFDFKGGYNTFIALSSDRRFLAVTSPEIQDRSFLIHVCDAVTGKLLYDLTEPTNGWLRDLAFSPDSKTLAACNYESIYLWEVDSATPQATFKAPGTGFSVLAFSPNGKLLASGCRDGSVRLWNTTAKQQGVGGKIGQYLPTLMLKKHKSEVFTLAFSPDGKMLLSGSYDGTIRAWDTTTGKQHFTCREHLDGISDIATPKGENTLTSIDTMHTQIRHWDIDKGHQLSVSYLGFNSSEKISPNATTLAMHDLSERKLRLWDILNRRFKTNLKGHGYSSRPLNPVFAFSLDEKMLASASMGNYIRIIHLWDIGEPPRSFLKRFFFNFKTIRPQWTLEGHRGVILALAFSPDRRTLASAGDGVTIYLWDLETFSTRLTLTGHKEGSRKLVFSPDGRTLASRGYKEIYLWDVATGGLLRTLSTEAGIGTFQFSPDGKVLVAYGVDGIIQLWDVRTGQRMSSHKGHTRLIKDFVFSADGKTLASASEDGTILLWDWEKIAQVKN